MLKLLFARFVRLIKDGDSVKSAKLSLKGPFIVCIGFLEKIMLATFCRIQHGLEPTGTSCAPLVLHADVRDIYSGQLFSSGVIIELDCHIFL